MKISDKPFVKSFGTCERCPHPATVRYSDQGQVLFRFCVKDDADFQREQAEERKQFGLRWLADRAEPSFVVTPEDRAKSAGYGEGLKEAASQAEHLAAMHPVTREGIGRALRAFAEEWARE